VSTQVAQAGDHFAFALRVIGQQSGRMHHVRMLWPRACSFTATLPVA
jgi:hypothetical protein